MTRYRAEAYLRRLGAFEKVADLYDNNEMLQMALAAWIPEFEYPDHSHKTVRQILNIPEEFT